MKKNNKHAVYQEVIGLTNRQEHLEEKKASGYQEKETG